MRSFKRKKRQIAPNAAAKEACWAAPEVMFVIRTCSSGWRNQQFNNKNPSVSNQQPARLLGNRSLGFHLTSFSIFSSQNCSWMLLVTRRDWILFGQSTSTRLLWLQLTKYWHRRFTPFYLNSSLFGRHVSVREATVVSLSQMQAVKKLDSMAILPSLSYFIQ